jgi:hypothetical protein
MTAALLLVAGATRDGLHRLAAISRPRHGDRVAPKAPFFALCPETVL